MRSLSTGFDEMRSLLNDFNFDVFGVSETWLSPGTPSGAFEIPGYTLLRADRSARVEQPRPRPDTGGGVAVYIRDNIAFQMYELSDVAPGIEHIAVTLRVRGGDIGFVTVYRPPDVSYTCLNSLFNAVFIDMAAEVETVICLGDNNIDLFSSTCYDAKYLRRLMNTFNTVQHVTEPTRVTENSATLIDHIIVEKSTQLERCGVVDASSILDYRGRKITDHKLVYCCIQRIVEKTAAKVITYRDFKNFDLDAALTDLANINWECVKQIDGVNNIDKFISGNIIDVYNKYAPVVLKKVTKKKAPWRNKEIVELTKRKNKLRSKYWKTRDVRDWSEYKFFRNKLNCVTWRAKKDFFSDKLADCKGPKEFWKCLRQGDVLNKSSNNLPNDMKANKINEHFVTMGSFYDADNELNRFYEWNKHGGLQNSFQFREVTEDEVKSAMNGITSKAVGTDGLSIDMIKAVSPYALGAITHLINESLKSCEFPQSWKVSIVHPLPKTKSPSSVSQLRPISVLPAISKILEKIAIRQIEKFVHDEKILPKLQSGFRRNHSTCTALTNLFADLFEARDRGRCSSVVMLDFSQAFDSISHSLLLAKLSYFGFQNDAVNWVRSYIEGRQQVTRVGSDTSAPLAKVRGVPQGSCLGPLLFTLYTADLPSCAQHCTVHAYADDCQLHLSFDPNSVSLAVGRLNSDLERIRTWSVRHGLKLNVDKCTVLHVASPTQLLHLKEAGIRVTLGGESLQACDSVRTLGVVLDSGLAFSGHVTCVIQQALGRLRGLYRHRSVLPETAKLRLIQSVVLSVLYYCYPAYGNSISREDTERIQRLQNSAVRFVFSLSRRDHVSPFRDAVNLLPMEAVCRMQTCCLVNRVLTLREPLYLAERLVSRGEVAQRSTRQDSQLHFPGVRLEVGRRGFNYFGPKLYNDLPNNLKSLKGAGFKTKIKQLAFS